MKKLFKKIASFFVSLAILLRIKKRKIEPTFATSQPYIIAVENDSDEWKDYELFGASRNYVKVKDGVLNLNGVIIKSHISNTEYSDLLMSSIVKPFKVGITYVLCDEMGKFLSVKKPLLYVRTDANGNCHGKNILLIQDPYQNQTDIIALKNIYGIDGFVKLKGKIPPKSKMQFHFYPLAENDLPINAEI